MDQPGNPSPRNLLSRRTLLAGAGVATAAGLGVAVPAEAVSGTPVPEPCLTARQQAAQRVVFSYPGTTVPQSLLDLIAAGLCGGVILFGENVSSLSQVTAAVGLMHEANASSPVKAPLLVMTDQEGGKVRRLPGGPVPTAKQIGESPDPAAAAADAGQVAGRLLRGAGLNVNLAPVLDVFRTPGDFEDQFQRSFSMDPNVVALCGRSFVAAQQDERVAATAKHFPGLGPATAQQNTDLGPVTLGTSRADLRRIDELPYDAAVHAGVKLVMLSWAVYTGLDPELPAGLSPTVIDGELRRRHGFHGVTITDAINAGALDAFGTPPQNAVTAAAAGMDLILEATRDVSNGQAVVDSLAAALTDGTLNRHRSDAALHRILQLRATLA
ncbi:glycoside hydrolase family 3 N-terminal domain-containing protein [Yinghuangia seranimata]|uniref:glycoside hydrolase family 3 N-terminal domain-containing protein n=1 Tax=Yinghuangia seranimata TaxID=408067 RepID=UPI00248C04D1|nr:glycoside hydrolase family 3 N-terminal domain-containing protein [Yinghuangia seranimata]MDI2127729.1 glycoside hydrolase family 3 N-terminal domain-containing protein [Yinghuangia seranimata]